MKLSYPQLKNLVATYVTENKISVATFNVTRDNTVELVDKIGKIVHQVQDFQDKLAFFDGEDLGYGKTIEEWASDLILVEDYEETGADALAPKDPTYRPNFYSYTIGKKKIKTTIRNNDLERAVHFEAQLVEIVSNKTKMLMDSATLYRYQVKREMIAKMYAIASGLQTTSTQFAAATPYSIGTALKDSASTARGIVVKPYKANDATGWADAVAKGFIVVLDLITEVATPVDTASGEAFIKQVKRDVEIGSDFSEGHSLNGNTMGAAEGLVLIVKQGVMPNLEVDVEAGAFHLNKVAIPAETHVVKDFGSADPSVYAVLVDRRAIKLHNTYRAVREQQNGEGDFLNLVYHTEDTPYISRNVFVKFYKTPAGA